MQYKLESRHSTIEKTSDTAYRVVNIAYQDGGPTTETEEEWSFVDADRYTYTIYQVENGERTPWYTGEWVRAGKDD